jgi:hypothetical protein
MSSPPFSLSGFTNAGSAQSFGITPNPTKLDHWSKANGIKLKDFQAIISFEAEVDMKFDEFDEDNLELAFFGSEVSSGMIEIGNSSSIIQREVAFVGSNTYGPNVAILLPRVSFRCNKVIEFIGESAWGELELTGEMLAVNGNYGAIWFIANDPVAAPNVDNYYFGMGQVWTAPLGTVGV